MCMAFKKILMTAITVTMMLYIVHFKIFNSFQLIIVLCEVKTLFCFAACFFYKSFLLEENDIFGPKAIYQHSK